jgi:hypothetical protein
MLDDGELVKLRQRAAREWMKGVPEDMTAIVFYGYDREPGWMVRPGPDGATGGKLFPQTPNGKTVVFVLPLERQFLTLSGNQRILVGKAVTSKHDQWCRQKGRSAALGRALVALDRKKWERRSANQLDRKGSVVHTYSYGLSEHAVYGEDGRLDAKLTTEKLKPWATEQGWI